MSEDMAKGVTPTALDEARAFAKRMRPHVYYDHATLEVTEDVVRRTHERSAASGTDASLAARKLAARDRTDEHVAELEAELESVIRALDEARLARGEFLKKHGRWLMGQEGCPLCHCYNHPVRE